MQESAASSLRVTGSDQRAMGCDQDKRPRGQSPMPTGQSILPDGALDDGNAAGQEDDQEHGVSAEEASQSPGRREQAAAGLELAPALGADPERDSDAETQPG
jgi:hypothetical protein